MYAWECLCEPWQVLKATAWLFWARHLAQRPTSQRTVRSQLFRNPRSWPVPERCAVRGTPADAATCSTVVWNTKYLTVLFYAGFKASNEVRNNHEWLQGENVEGISTCTGVLISPYPDLLPDVFCLMVRMCRLMVVLLYIWIVLIFLKLRL
jgi:hypothetical protein